VTNHFNPWDVHRNVADPQFGVFFGRYRRWFKVDFDIFFMWSGVSRRPVTIGLFIVASNAT